MGKGSQTTQINVSKKLPALTDSKEVLLSATGTQGGGSRPERINQCMIAFVATVTDLTKGLKVGDNVAITLEGAAAVQIIHKGRKIASYTGDLAGTLVECMRAGYVYKGVVTNVNPSTFEAECRIQGYGKL